MLSVSAKKILFSIQVVFFSAFLLASQTGAAQQVPDDQAAAVTIPQVNINEADADTIAEILVGVGASRAIAIVQYREEHGRFTSLEQLLEVKGIGESTLMNNRDKIVIE